MGWHYSIAPLKVLFQALYQSSSIAVPHEQISNQKILFIINVQGFIWRISNIIGRSPIRLRRLIRFWPQNK